jgi:nucleotide-binding universal stress UspA family protein
VAAAMPLLACARRIVILSVNEDARTDAAGCEQPRQARVWHNLFATVRSLPITDADPADTLLRVAVEPCADSLVMGGYGHNRMCEMVYGGVTRHVPRAADLPVLMAH